MRADLFKRVRRFRAAAAEAERHTEALSALLRKKDANFDKMRSRCDKVLKWMGESSVGQVIGQS